MSPGKEASHAQEPHPVGDSGLACTHIHTRADQGQVLTPPHEGGPESLCHLLSEESFSGHRWPLTIMENELKCKNREKASRWGSTG